MISFKEVIRWLSSFFNLSRNYLEKKTVGISRLKSGSHTMAYYMKHLHGQNLSTNDELKFEVLGGFDKLRHGMVLSCFFIFIQQLLNALLRS
jgi:hypothetical protein